MFIYILNLLNDGLKKKRNFNIYSNFEIINDTRYISELAGIKRNYDIKNITDKIVNVYEVLDKYNLTDKDSIGILNKLLMNDNHLWILEYLYKGDNIIKENSELVFSSIIKNALEKEQNKRNINKDNILEVIKNVV